MAKYKFDLIDQQYVKTCTHCEQEYCANRPEDFFEYFNQNNATKDGYSSWCRECHQSATKRTIAQR